MNDEQLRALIAEWRERERNWADHASRLHTPSIRIRALARAACFGLCAEELERELAAE